MGKQERAARVGRRRADERAFTRQQTHDELKRLQTARPRPSETPASKPPSRERQMAKNLLIVESPSKAKTLKKYLGGDFEILASYGHVRDLVPKSGAVDPDNGFAMKYQLISRNGKHVDAIVAAAKEAENIYLATDPDREGEA
ncbi:TPA: toprim domain-containing protein, partial [Neisseria gonorrhoeae]